MTSSFFKIKNVLMKRITQKELSNKLGVNAPFLCNLLKGNKRPTADKAAKMESMSGIGRMSFLYAKPSEIKKELERVYGKINFRRGRVPKIKEVSK